MITIPIEDCNNFSQEIYDKIVNVLPIHMAQCKCGHTGCLIFHGRYTRGLKILSDFLSLTIQRVRCKFCGRTHAILPALIVPYSHIPREDQQDILMLNAEGKSPAPVLERNVLIDEGHVRHIIRQFKDHWKERILSLALSLRDSLTEPCISTFGLQFMQIRRTWNSFFSPPT